MRPRPHRQIPARLRAWLAGIVDLVAGMLRRRRQPDQPGARAGGTPPSPRPPHCGDARCLPVAVLVRELRFEYQLAVERASDQLRYCGDSLAEATAEGPPAGTDGDDHPRAAVWRELRELAADLDRIATQINAGTIHFGTVFDLESAIVGMRFIRPDNDVRDTDNPLFNITIWALEALVAAAVAARLGQSLNTAERFGLAEPKPPRP